MLPVPQQRPPTSVTSLFQSAAVIFSRFRVRSSSQQYHHLLQVTSSEVSVTRSHHQKSASHGHIIRSQRHKVTLSEISVTRSQQFTSHIIRSQHHEVSADHRFSSAESIISISALSPVYNVITQHHYSSPTDSSPGSPHWDKRKQRARAQQNLNPLLHIRGSV